MYLLNLMDSYIKILLTLLIETLENDIPVSDHEFSDDDSCPNSEDELIKVCVK